MPEGWSDFLVVEAGAAAALGGLLFVGLSLNLERILELAGVPNRAFTALVLLMTVLVVCSLMLLPHQPLLAIGVEVLAVAGLLWGWGTRSDITEYRQKTYYTLQVFAGDASLFQIAVVPYLVGGLLLIGGSEAGLFFVAASVILSFIKSVLDAWVLLVEIKR